MSDTRPIVISVPEPRSLELIFTPEDEAKLRRDYQVFEGQGPTVSKAVADHIAEASFIIGQPELPRHILRQAKKLKAILNVESNFLDNMDYDYCFANGIHVLTTGRVFATPVAEIGLGMALSLARGLVQDAFPNFKARKWGTESSVPLVDLYHKTIGLVGFGGIGTEIARRAHYGFEMKVLAVDPKPLPKPAFVAELREPGWLLEMASQVDVLVSCAPHTRETVKLFNESVFNRMKPTAYFINVSRGGLVDQEALVKALKEKKIAGAGLDVTTPEPLPAEHPLWDCPNLIITPHNSGMAPMRQVRLIALVTENVRRYSNGLALLNVVDKARGY